MTNTKTADFSIKIEDKEYTKKELIEAVVNEMNKQLGEGIYQYSPIDPDNFHTKFKFIKK